MKERPSYSDPFFDDEEYEDNGEGEEEDDDIKTA
jgi:hypothetical protein